MYILTSVLIDMTVFDHDMCGHLPRIRTKPLDPSEVEVHSFVEQELHDLVASPFYSTPVSSPVDVQSHVPQHTRIYQFWKRAIGVA